MSTKKNTLKELILDLAKGNSDDEPLSKKLKTNCFKKEWNIALRIGLLQVIEFMGIKELTVSVSPSCHFQARQIDTIACLVSICKFLLPACEKITEKIDILTKKFKVTKLKNQVRKCLGQKSVD